MRTQFLRLAFFVLVSVSIPFTTTAQTVNIPDLNLRAVIEAALGKASGNPITAAEMETLTYLEADNASISDLTGLEFAINLTELDLWDNSISDISPLAGLTNMIELDLWDNSISDISPLAGLTDMIQLYLGNNRISDISPLAKLTKLKRLTLAENSISETGALGIDTTSPPLQAVTFGRKRGILPRHVTDIH